MQKKIVISVASIVVVFVLLLTVLQMSGLFVVLTGGYKGTGLVLDTNTKISIYYGEQHSGLIGKKIMEGVNRDVFSNTPYTEYITAWRPTGVSEFIELKGTINGAGYRTGSATPWWAKDHIAIGEYYWEVYLTTVAGTRQIVGKTFFDDSVVEMASGSFGEQRFPHMNYQYPGGGPAGGWWMFVDCVSWDTVEWKQLATTSVGFKIKGQVIGGLEARLMVEYAELKLNNQWEAGTWHVSTKMMQSDRAYLLSGVGDITVEPVGYKKVQGAEVDDWGVEYTHYVFEEGGTITVSVDAGYSGDRWTLQLHNSKGQLVKTWGPADGLVDNVVGWKVQYTVPAGSWIRNDPDNNEWYFTLYNALFKVDKERVFTVDSYANIPGTTTVTTDREQYTQGDYIKATFSARMTSDPIEYFRCWARYGVTGEDYALPPGNFYVDGSSGDIYRVTVTFKADKGARYLTITGLAFDSAGRMGFEGEKTVYVTQAQPVYTVKVYVTDSSTGGALSGVQVRFADKTEMTDDLGFVEFSVEPGTYSIRLMKKGYIPITRDNLFINRETELNYQMVYDGVSPGPVDEMEPWSQYIIYIILGIVLLVGVMYGVMYYLKRKRMRK